MRNLIEAVIKLSGGSFRSDSPAAKFIEAVNDVTQEHPFDRRARLYGHASIEISPSVDDRNGMVHISDIMSMEAGKGHGSAALQMLCTLADQYGVKLEAIAKSYGKAHLTTLQLIEWYARYGFENRYPEDGEREEWELESDGMDIIRYPR